MTKKIFVDSEEIELTELESRNLPCMNVNTLELISKARYDWIAETGKNPKIIYMKPSIYKKLRRECSVDVMLCNGRMADIEVKNITFISGMEIKFLSSTNPLDFEIS